MKTHILRCESFDSIASLEDRLKWVKAGRVLLVMPEMDPPALSRRDFIRLRRQAGRLHADLGIVSQDAAMGEMAHSAGLPVFSSNEDARQEVWASIQATMPVKQRPEVAERIQSYRARVTKPLPGWARWLAFVLAILAILALIAMLLPKATVELNLPREEQVVELVVSASVDQPEPDLIAGIPLFRISSEVNARIEQKTSGVISVGDKSATGMVIFTNMTDRPLVIPDDAIVRSNEPSFRFSVIKGGNLAAGPGTTVTLQVKEMDGSGPGGNLPAGAIMALDPPLGLSVSVSNPEALSGGTMKSSPALTQADLLTGEAVFKQALDQAFIEKVTEYLPDDVRLIRESIVVDDIRVLDTPPPFDQLLTSFEVYRVAQMTGYYFLESDLKKWALMAMNESLMTGWVAAPGPPVVEVISIDYGDDNNEFITMRATSQTIPAFYPEEITVQLRGLKSEEAANLIQGALIPGSQPVITLSPSWWFWLPFIPQRIEING